MTSQQAKVSVLNVEHERNEICGKLPVKIATLIMVMLKIFFAPEVYFSTGDTYC